MKRTLVALAVFALLAQLAGCEAVPRVVQVRVPVPVACQVEEPQRPALGIDSMPIDAPVDELVRNLRADHDVRDGYEGELRAALRACRTIGAAP